MLQQYLNFLFRVLRSGFQAQTGITIGPGTRNLNPEHFSNFSATSDNGTMSNDTHDR
jgi:hypothetical protein